MLMEMAGTRQVCKARLLGRVGIGEMSAGVLLMLQYVRPHLTCPPACPFSEQVLASGRCCCQPERAVSNQRWGRADDEGAWATLRQQGGAVALGQGGVVVLLSRDKCVGGTQDQERVWTARAGNCDGGASCFQMIWDWFAQV